MSDKSDEEQVQEWQLLTFERLLIIMYLVLLAILLHNIIQYLIR